MISPAAGQGRDTPSPSGPLTSHLPPPALALTFLFKGEILAWI